MGFWGPGHEEVWQQLAATIGAEFTDGGWFGHDRIEFRWREWLITLDQYVVSNGKTSTTYSRMRAPYVNSDGFYFKVYRKGFFSDAGKKLGMVDDLEIGERSFDDAFIVQSNDDAKVRALLGVLGLRRLIEAQPDISFEVKDDEGWFGPAFPQGVDELYFIARGLITDGEQLKKLFQLFCEVLDYLQRTGSAGASNPGVGLN